VKNAIGLSVMCRQPPGCRYTLYIPLHVHWKSLSQI